MKKELDLADLPKLAEAIQLVVAKRLTKTNLSKWMKEKGYGRLSFKQIAALYEEAKKRLMSERR